MKVKGKAEAQETSLQQAKHQRQEQEQEKGQRLRSLDPRKIEGQEEPTSSSYHLKLGKTTVG